VTFKSCSKQSAVADAAVVFRSAGEDADDFMLLLVSMDPLQLFVRTVERFAS
jgi:hypothetical protein